MNEAAKPRFAVDLEEIERQLAQAQAVPSSHAAPVNRNDPLAELARIVGQEDPFQSLLAADRQRAQSKQPSGFDDLFVTPDGGRHGQPHGRPESHDPYGYAGAQRGDGPAAQKPAARRASYEAPEPPSHGGYDSSAYDQAAYDQAAYDQAAFEQQSFYPQNAAPYPAMEDTEFDETPHVRSRKGRVLAGALLASVVVVGGGIYLFGGASTMLNSGEPPLITANNEPVKVQPQSPGGLEIPNQNKQIYERANQDTKTRVVNREEQPVDVRQAARLASDGASSDASRTASTGLSHPAPAPGGLNLGEPRRVRTVAIRPDGSIIGAEPPAPARPAPVLPPASAGSSATAQDDAAATPAASATPPAQPRQVATPQISPIPRMVMPSGVTGVGSPQAPSATPSAPAPQRVASAQPTAIAPEPAAPEPVPTGGFAVQLAVTGSEAEARTTFGKLQQKYDGLESQNSIIRKAEVNGNTIYRVRVGPMSREDASSLCSKIQGQGGQCFVAKNN